jgi:two-component sensor histidine kinase
MSDSSSQTPVTTIHFRPRPSIAISTVNYKLRAALTDELHASLGREAAWRQEYLIAIQSQHLRSREFEHRIFNGLQMVVSLLVVQSMRVTPEMAVHLRMAAGRVAAIRGVHQRLHSLSSLDKVDFKQYLHHLCEELSGLLFEEKTGRAIEVQCCDLELPATLGGPLGMIVNELITNAAKHTEGDITVRVEPTSPVSYSLSVLDKGPGLPANFDPAESRGLGMKIVLSLLKEIGGELHVFPGGNGAGARFTIAFNPSDPIRIPNTPEDRERFRIGGYDGGLLPHAQRSGATSFRSPCPD